MYTEPDITGNEIGNNSSRGRLTQPPYGCLHRYIDDGILRPSGEGRLSLLATFSYGVEGNLARYMEKRLRPIINPKNRRQVSFAVETTLYNCWRCYQCQMLAPAGIRIVAVYSRDYSDYRSCSRYGMKDLSVRVLIKVLAQLSNLGLIEQRIEAPLRGMRSSYWPTAETANLIEEGFQESDIKKLCRETVILKGADGALADYKDTRRTREMRKVIRELNMNNQVHKIDIEVGEEMVEAVEIPRFDWDGIIGSSATTLWTITTDRKRYLIDLQGEKEGALTTLSSYHHSPLSLYTSNNNTHELTSIPANMSILQSVTSHIDHEQKLLITPLNPLAFYTRNFCRGDWSKGGRWYAHVQNVPSALRPYITIDGQRTVELDYAALHARLLYSKAGVVPKGDPYTVRLDGWRDPRTLRSAIKLAFQVFLNVGSRRAAVVTLDGCIEKGEIAMEPGFGSSDLLNAFEEAHPAIAQFMCTDMGVALQNVDAEIAATVFSRFVEAQRPVIGIHDSFVVKMEDEDFLRGAMENAYRDKVGQDPELKRTEGCSRTPILGFDGGTRSTSATVSGPATVVKGSSTTLCAPACIVVGQSPSSPSDFANHEDQSDDSALPAKA